MYVNGTVNIPDAGTVCSFTRQLCKLILCATYVVAIVYYCIALGYLATCISCCLGPSAALELLAQLAQLQ